MVYCQDWHLYQRAIVPEICIVWKTKDLTEAQILHLEELKTLLTFMKKCRPEVTEVC